MGEGLGLNKEEAARNIEKGKKKDELKVKIENGTASLIDFDEYLKLSFLHLQQSHELFPDDKQISINLTYFRTAHERNYQTEKAKFCENNVNNLKASIKMIKEQRLKKSLIQVFRKQASGWERMKLLCKQVPQPISFSLTPPPLKKVA